jgi:putative Holliday junction resolvase
MGSGFAPSSYRVLALDVGEKRIGLAISDERGTFATPLTTLNAVPRAGAFQQVATIVQQYAVQYVVVGLPLTLSGEIGPQAALVKTFATALEQTLGQTVHLFDERLTSVAAEQMMRDMGIKPSKRKARRDEIAACLILQDYLDCRRNGGGTYATATG